MNTALAQAIDQHGLGERIDAGAFNDDYIKSVGKFAQFENGKELGAPYRAKPFEDRRCPVCRRFVCGGC